MRIKRRLIVISLAVVGLMLSNTGNIQVGAEEKKNIFQDDKSEGFNQQEELAASEIRRGSYSNEKPPEYAAGELIVKLKEGRTLADIGGLNNKYAVSATEKVFKKAADPRQALQGLKTKLADFSREHEKWYWQIDKDSQEYKDYQAKIEKEKEQLQKQIQAQEELVARLEQRQKRSPEGIEVPKLENTYVLKTGQNANIQEIAKEYSANPNVEYAEPNYIVKVQMFPNDPYYSSKGSWGQGYDDLWGLKKIEAEKAWDISQGEGVVVAVVDTGIDYNHEDIADNIWINKAEIPNNGIDDDKNGYIDDVRGWDFVNKDNDPMDGYGHGTHVSGTIAAVGNNNIGVIGVAPKAKVMAVKGLDDTGSGSDSDLADCLKYAADRGADVINNSWGGSGTSKVIEDAISFAYAAGCIVVNSAGNSNADVIGFYPASNPHGICVAAVDSALTKSSFSNFGIRLDVAAPGRDILSLRAQNTIFSDSLTVGKKYLRLNGTSMAAPHVSGLAALILSLRSDWGVDKVRAALRINAMKNGGVIGSDKILGDGCVQGYETVKFSHTQNPPAIYGWLDQFQEINKGSINLKGTAGGYGFSSYEVYIAPYVSSAEENGYQWQLLFSGLEPVNNGTIGTLDTTKLKDGYHYLKLVIHSNPALYGQYEVITSYRVFVGNHYKDGWPKMAGKIVDLNIFRDEKGYEKILAYAIDGRLNLLNGDGTIVAGRWPVEIKTLYPDITRFVAAQPAIGDIEGDGRDEIVWAVSVYSDMLGWKTDVLVFKGDGNFKEGTWSAPHTISSGDGVKTGIVLGDINKDGKLELVLITQDTTNRDMYKLWVLDYQGNSFSANWPKVLEIPAGRRIYGTNLFPAVGDLDGNPFSLEIVVGTRELPYPFPETSYYDEGSLYAFDIFGKQLPGWPVHSNQTSLIATFDGICPVLADIDDNGRSEVYIDGKWCSMHSFMFDYDGQPHSGWPLYEYHDQYNPNAFADLDADGRAEAIASGVQPGGPDGSDDLVFAVYARKGDGSDFTTNWPRIFTLKDCCALNIQPGLRAASGPLVADADGDNQLDIIAQAYNRIFIFKKDGTLLTDSFELYTKDFCQNFNAPAIGDIDRDGLSELIATDYSGQIYVWDLPAVYNTRNTAWPVLQHDPQHTGFYTVSPPVPANITSPSQNQILSTKTVTFQWDQGLGVKRYKLKVGTAPAIGNIYSGEQVTNSSVTVNNIPLRGAPIYVALGSLIYDKYVYQYYTYQTKNLDGGLGYLAFPKEGTVLGNSTVTFTWSAAPKGEYYTLSLGTGMTKGDIWDSGIVEGTSLIVTGIPITGNPIYVRLGTKLVNDPYVVNMFYTFKTAKTLPKKKVNKPPIAKISAFPFEGKSPLKVTFNASGSSDPDGKIISYFWNFGNGKTSTQMNPSSTFKNSSWRHNKYYTVNLTVKDNLGAVSTAQIKVKVRPWWKCW